MTTEAIIESGMTFGPYPEGQCFYIEKSKCYSQVQEGVQMAEFLLLRQQQQGSTMWVVEAKSSCPREYNSYIEEIRVKLLNAFMLGVAACLDRHAPAKDELPESFRNLALKTTDFRFALVVKGVPEEHLPNLQNALSAVLKPVVKTWSMLPTSVVVLNEVSAQKHGLILPVIAVAQ